MEKEEFVGRYSEVEMWDINAMIVKKTRQHYSAKIVSKMEITPSIALHFLIIALEFAIVGI